MCRLLSLINSMPLPCFLQVEKIMQGNIRLFCAYLSLFSSLSHALFMLSGPSPYSHDCPEYIYNGILIDLLSTSRPWKIQRFLSIMQATMNLLRHGIHRQKLRPVIYTPPYSFHRNVIIGISHTSDHVLQLPCFRMPIILGMLMLIAVAVSFPLHGSDIHILWDPQNFMRTIIRMRKEEKL